jgi:hypothetical protein
MRRKVLLAGCAGLAANAQLVAAATKDGFMDQIDQSTDKPNPKAPAALSQFAFLIGHWRFDAKFKLPQGEWQTFHGTWIGRYILNGYAIADEYRMLGSGGEIVVHGMNFRVYDAAKQVWNIKWLSALEGRWTDLTSEEFGGAKFEGQSVSYTFSRTQRSVQGLGGGVHPGNIHKRVTDTFHLARGQIRRQGDLDRIHGR